MVEGRVHAIFCPVCGLPGTFVCTDQMKNTQIIECQDHGTIGQADIFGAYALFSKEYVENLNVKHI